MKRLRNVGIYYTVFGALLAISFVFFKLWRISILGILLLLTYLVLRFWFKKKTLPTRLTSDQLRSWSLFLMVFPFIYVAATLWYIDRLYRQSIILPAGYEGVVAVQYDRQEGQKRKWIGGFLSIGASRVIKIDSSGIAKTRFKFLHNAIPFLDVEQHVQNDGGLKIYYENDLNNEILAGANGVYNTYKSKTKGQPNIYFTGYNQYPLIIFVVAKPEHYYKYFMTEIQKDSLEQVYKSDPYNNYPSDENQLSRQYNKFNRLDSNYKN
ncbi:hypothetical protein ABIB40_000409 [Pedobacter sp. UYP30]|uniref:hypothetical protein n=1 Tax=Pedobacter sp. UYP30 TaxID=1756400 RepID=UPI003395B548